MRLCVGQNKIVLVSGGALLCMFWIMAFQACRSQKLPVACVVLYERRIGLVFQFLQLAENGLKILFGFLQFGWVT